MRRRSRIKEGKRGGGGRRRIEGSNSMNYCCEDDSISWDEGVVAVTILFFLFLPLFLPSFLIFLFLGFSLFCCSLCVDILMILEFLFICYEMNRHTMCLSECVCEWLSTCLCISVCVRACVYMYVCVSTFPWTESALDASLACEIHHFIAFRSLRVDAFLSWECKWGEVKSVSYRPCG